MEEGDLGAVNWKGGEESLREHGKVGERMRGMTQLYFN